MKLIMHNFLACNIRGVKNGYPLEIEATKVEMRDADFDPGASQIGVCKLLNQTASILVRSLTPTYHTEFIRKIMERVNYDVLRNAVTQMGLPVELPAQLDRDRLQNDDDNILQHLHHTLFEAHLEEGNLVCPESGRKFPISKGIANMLLHADEV